MQELIYSIDADLSNKNDVLAIRIQHAEKISLDFTPAPTQQILTRDKLNSFSTSRDASILPFLIKEELAYLKKNKRGLGNDTPFNIIHIPYSEVLQAFKLFSISGKLHYNGKALVIDLISKTEFFYQIDGTSGTTVVEGYFTSKGQEFNISACDYIGRGAPHWYIKGVSLKLIATDVSWKDLKNMSSGSSKPYRELIEDADEDPEAPRVVIKGSLTIPNNEPLPIFHLKDRLGSFGDLSMVYTDSSGKFLQEVDYHDPRPNIEHNGKAVAKRMKAVEQGWEKDLLETGFTKKPLATSRYYCPLDKVAKSIAFLLDVGWQVRDWRGNKIAQLKNTDLAAISLADEIVIKGKMRFDTFEADVTDIIGAFNRRERFAELLPGHVALLPQNLEEFGLHDLSQEGEIIGKEIRIKQNQVGSLSGLFEDHPKMSLDSTVASLKDKLSSFQSVEITPPGSSFKGTLRPYQQEGLNWLSFLYAFHFHGILADDMGLGKTVQVLAFLSRLEEISIASRHAVLIVVPTSLIFNWKNEIEKFLPNTPVIIHHGPERCQELPQQLLLSQERLQIILTTYTTARNDASQLANIPFECLILDEAQAIKNASTQTAKILSKFKSQFRLSITGTPVENHLMELWSHFNFLIPDLFGDESSFQAEVQAGMSDSRFIKRIKKKIRPFLLRRRKEEVAKDLPEKIEQIVWITMHEKQRKVYEEFLSGVRRNLIPKVNADGSTKHRMEILESIMRLRQICCHPLLVHHDETDPEALQSSKLDALLEDLDTALEEGRKVLVYSQFTTMLGLMAKNLKSRNISFAYLDGSTKNREAVVDSFQNDPQLQIFLISLKAGGIGLNLTAADYVFIYDPWWNDAAENQAIDRAHRIGRKDTVIAKRYILEDSIEQKMIKLKAAKSSLAADLLDDEGAVSGSLTADDLLFLLS